MTDSWQNNVKQPNEKEVSILYTGKGKITTDVAYIPEGIRYVTVHKSGEDDYRFTLGVSLIKFNNFWVCAYLQSKDKENDAQSRFVCKYSYNDCKTWGGINVIAPAEEEYSRSHGVLWNSGDRLWAFCPRAAFGKALAGETYPNLVMEAYVLETDMKWTYRGIALEDHFWPLCEPIKFSDGSMLMAGLECGSNTWQGAVALSSGDPMNWKMIVIPNPDNIQVWGETTVIDCGDFLAAIIRTNRTSGYAAVSFSRDNGRTWSDLSMSNLDMVASKPYGGSLTDGRKYLILNIPHGDGTPEDLRNRRKLAITLSGRNTGLGFEKTYIIKNGYTDNPSWFSRQWAYPYAVENNRSLYVVYTKHKEGNELAVIPVDQL